MSVNQFLASHNLTASPQLTRMGLAEVRIWYNAVAYSPQVNGVAYALELEEPNMFGEDAPQDLVRHQVDEMDLDLTEDKPAQPKLPMIEHVKTDRVAA